MEFVGSNPVQVHIRQEPYLLYYFSSPQILQNFEDINLK